MRNAYVDLCLSIQAIRRHFEGIRTPLAPATGIAAHLYTHQLANVLRVVTDVRVRHLLADEVGLGKTVQALMVLNALRSQRQDLQALIIVPDRLVPQWRDEIMTRAHTAPHDKGNTEEESEGIESAQYIRLAWEAQLRMTDAQGKPRLALTDIDPGRYNVLIIDELHRLRADLQDRIVRMAADFEHVLVLTATPALQRVERHAQLFALLEPERTAISRWRCATSERGTVEQLSVGDDLSKWPEWAATTVVDDIIGRDRAAAASAEDQELPALAMANCAYRRVIRTRREDYSGVLPRRHHYPLVVEPLGSEADRQSLMWQYFLYLKDLSRRFDPVLLAKRVILSPPSLEQRVDFLRRQGHEREGLLERVKPLVHRSKGDSRADALVDLLAEIWALNPSERVLVAAQDNLTVDYLYEMVLARLPEVGPLEQRVPLKAALIRQGQTEEMLEDVAGYGNDTAINLDEFQRGEALVLFAPEKAQVGLNLQRARVLILYSVPWRPEEVEQWIGRLDRIGNTAAFSHEGEAKTVDVYTIAQRGLVDEKVVMVLQRFHVFERSVNLDGDHLEEVAKLIEDAALRPENISWPELAKATEVMAAEDEVQELESRLRPYLPWSVRWAKAEHQRLEALPPAPPVLRKLPEHTETGPKAWDRAFEVMLKLLKRAGDYHIRWNTDPETGSRFQTLWYQFGDREIYGQRVVRSEVVFSFGADPAHERSPRYAHAFITRRGDIGNPPRRKVIMPLNGDRVRRHLRFLNFGESLHDELIRGWLPQRAETLQVDVSFFDDHAIWEHSTSGIYILRISILDPADALIGRGIEDWTREAIGRAAACSSTDRLLELIKPFTEAINCALEADVRWLRAQLTATMRLDTRRRQGERWVPIEAEAAQALLNPLSHGRSGVPRADDLCVSKEIYEAAEDELNRMRNDDISAARSSWSHRIPEFQATLQKRLVVVLEEGRDAVALASEELRYAEEGLEVALEKGNRPQITRAENARDAAADKLSMVEVFWQHRYRWLQECEEKVLSVQPREQLTALLRARETQ